MDHIMSDENLDLCIRACRPQFPASAHLLRRQAEEIIALRARLAAAEAELDKLNGMLDDLFTQGLDDVAPGWVSVPTVEWESVKSTWAALRGEEVKGE